MKNFLILLFITNSIATYSQSNIVIGMKLEDVKKICTDCKISVYENTTTLETPVTLYGLDDSWGYRFQGDTLTWIFFHKYIDELNDANFKKCLSATEQIIKDYTLLYGIPDTTIIGDTTFVDPYVKHHWGYDVIEARWKNYKGMKIKVEFTFMGGKGVYHLIVQINYFDKDYPYYE